MGFIGPSPPALSADISLDFDSVLPGLYVTCVFGEFSLLKERFFGSPRIFETKRRVNFAKSRSHDCFLVGKFIQSISD